MITVYLNYLRHWHFWNCINYWAEKIWQGKHLTSCRWVPWIIHGWVPHCECITNMQTFAAVGYKNFKISGVKIWLGVQIPTFGSPWPSSGALFLYGSLGRVSWNYERFRLVCYHLLGFGRKPIFLFFPVVFPFMKFRLIYKRVENFSRPKPRKLYIILRSHYFMKVYWKNLAETPIFVKLVEVRTFRFRAFSLVIKMTLWPSMSRNFSYL